MYWVVQLRPASVVASIENVCVLRFSPATQPWSGVRNAAASGRMLPDGLAYVSSWVAADGMDRCFQLMETDEPALFAAWIERWNDLVEFEVVPVVTSAEAAARARGA